MITLFVLVLLNGKDSVVLPHQYENEEACHLAAFSHRNEYENFACIKLQIETNNGG